MSSVEELTSYLEELKLINAQLKASIKTILADNEEIGRQIYIKQQQCLSKYIEIFGVPRNANEDCSLIVQNIGSKLGIELKVMKANRKPENIGVGVSKIVAELESFAQKKKLMNLIKQKGLHTNQLNETWPATVISIHNSLTPHYRELLYKSKLLARIRHYRYVWYRNMEVCVQKDNDFDIIRIQLHSDLSKIV